MLPMLMIGTIILMLGCDDASKSEGYFVNNDPGSAQYGLVRHGKVNFDYTVEDRNQVLAWTNTQTQPVITEPFANVHKQLFCVDMEYFFKTIKPEALKAHDEFWDKEDN